jgi:endonuclease/exonuclease/phosphatase family metal-dependent hydrolase
MTHSIRFLALGLLAAVALAGCARKPQPPVAQGDGQGFSVLTYNIWHDQRDWPARKAMMLAEIRELNPDIIGLQEVLQRETLPNQAETLARELGYEYTFSTTDPPDRAHRYGNAILSRHPVLATDMRLLNPRDDYRTAAHMRVNINGLVVDVYNTHLHHTRDGGAIRREQIEDLLDFVESTREGTDVILMGDFNANPDWPELQLVTADYIDTFAMFVDDPLSEDHATLNWHIGHSKRRIDYVFQHRASMDSFRPVNSRIVLTEPDETGEVWASDHFGVMTWFQ